MTARAGGAATRRQVRAARRALTPEQRDQASASMRMHIRTLPAFRSARRVALFFPFDGEPDLSPLIRFDQGREFFAPVITRSDMVFAAIDARTRLVSNFFGIPEPEFPQCIDPRSLDLVLTPLVAFDGRGTRLGVGAGYYDRCFAFLRQRRLWLKPKLLGCGYSLQRCDALRANPWDVPLWGAITEAGFEHFR